jgi:4-amino-4-deoxy-L-arabinose transferase-like glycosyltransferase
MHPQVDWGGTEGYVESEFPLYPAAVATVYLFTGPDDVYGRVVSVAFSTALIGVTYLLGAELMGAGAGLAAAFLVAVSPSAVFFGRTFMPDSTMLFFWVLGVFAFVRHLRKTTTDDGTPRIQPTVWLWIGASAAALGCLAKLPAVMMFAPIVAAGWHWRGRMLVRDYWLAAALVIPVLVTLAWYVHAERIFQQTGLTFGILLNPAKTYPIDIAPGPWPQAWSKFTRADMLLSSDFYLRIIGRLYHVLLLPWGLVGALAGIAMLRWRDGRIVVDAWLAAMLLFVVVMGEANLAHEYYQLPLVPVCALYFGGAVAPLFDGSWSLAQGRGLARGAVLLATALLGFYYSGVARSHFRRDSLDVRILDVGVAVQRAVPADALIVAVDDYGVTSPMLLYFANLKGWSLGLENTEPAVIDGLRRRGARYFVTTLWPRIERELPQTTYYLQTFPRVEVSNPPEGLAVFDIGALRE